MQQLYNIAMSDRSGWTAHHKALPRRSINITQLHQTHNLHYGGPVTLDMKNVLEVGNQAYFLGSLIIHQLLTSLKG